MNRLTLVVTSEIKYAELYCNNKERKPLLVNFINNKKDNSLARDVIEVRPTNTLLVKY